MVDQHTYPAGDAEGAKVAAVELRSLLARVDLEYLLEREDVLTSETNWEEVAYALLMQLAIFAYTSIYLFTVLFTVLSSSSTS
eukprot:SAG11_NODE_32573_length_282_cov_1.136612_1_plen_82_part_01